MDRDPSKVGRAKVVAETIAEVVNGFVEPISWKTLVRRDFCHPIVVYPNHIIFCLLCSFSH